MANLKYYNSGTEEWETLVIGKQGPTGPQGVPGNDGALSPNAVINGGFDIWQRGTSGLTFGNSLLNAFSADRWSSYRPANHTAITITRGTASGVPNSPNFVRLQRVASNTSTERVTFGQTIEIANASVFAGQTVTFSYYARRGANYSATDNQVFSQLKTGTGATDLNGIYNAYTGTVVNNALNTLSLDFQRFTRTIAIPSNATQIAFMWEFTPVGTAGENDYVEITGVQIEAGTVATPFKRNAPSIQAELAACQRYYFRNTPGALYGVVGYGIAGSTTTASISVVSPVPLRVPATSLEYLDLLLGDGTNLSATIGSANLSLNTFTTNRFITDLSLSGLSGLTQFRPYRLQSSNSATGFIGISAEL